MMLLSTLLAACGGSDGGLVDEDAHAVGTFVGGGSFLTGPGACTLQAAPGILAGDGSAAGAPRFVLAPGAITEVCPEARRALTAVAPDGVAISGPERGTVGETSGLLQANLTAAGRVLRGEPSLDWRLGPDCEGRATFAPVTGAQDTGGPDRTRSLVPTSPGPCTVHVKATTGSALFPEHASRTFEAEHRVTFR